MNNTSKDIFRFDIPDVATDERLTPFTDGQRLDNQARELGKQAKAEVKKAYGAADIFGASLVEDDARVISAHSTSGDSVTVNLRTAVQGSLKGLLAAFASGKRSGEDERLLLSRNGAKLKELAGTDEEFIIAASITALVTDKGIGNKSGKMAQSFDILAKAVSAATLGEDSTVRNKAKAFCKLWNCPEAIFAAIVQAGIIGERAVLARSLAQAQMQKAQETQHALITARRDAEARDANSPEKVSARKDAISEMRVKPETKRRTVTTSTAPLLNTSQPPMQ